MSPNRFFLIQILFPGVILVRTFNLLTNQFAAVAVGLLIFMHSINWLLYCCTVKDFRFDSKQVLISIYYSLKKAKNINI